MLNEVQLIRKRLTLLVWCIAPLSAVCIAFAVLVLISFVRDVRRERTSHTTFEVPHSTRVLAAVEDTSAGEVVAVELFGVRTVADEELPYGYILPHDIVRIAGYKLTRTLHARQPLSWYDLDIERRHVSGGENEDSQQSPAGDRLESPPEE